MKDASWTQAAIDDLRAANAYIHEYHPALARDFVERAVAAGRFLIEYPSIGTPMEGRWRKWRIPRTRYLLIYRPYRKGIEIGRLRYDRSNWQLVPQ